MSSEVTFVLIGPHHELHVAEVAIFQHLPGIPYIQLYKVYSKC